MAPTRTEVLLPADRRDKSEPISVTAVHETTHAEKVTPAPPHWQVQLGAGDTSHRRRGAQSKPPILRYIDPHEHVAKDWKRPTKLYEPPTVTQTKLGGTLVRPESRCSAKRSRMWSTRSWKAIKKLSSCKSNGAMPSPFLGSRNGYREKLRGQNPYLQIQTTYSNKSLCH